MGQCAVTISSARRVYALCHAATAGSGSEVSLIVTSETPLHRPAPSLRLDRTLASRPDERNCSEWGAARSALLC